MPSDELEHLFVWDDELASQLEHDAPPVSTRPTWWETNADFLYCVFQQNEKFLQTRPLPGYDLPGAAAFYSLDALQLTNRTYVCPKSLTELPSQKYKETRVVVANVDTATALRALQPEFDAVALSLATAKCGGGYSKGSRTQEAELCRLMPPLYWQLRCLKNRPSRCEVHYTRTILARQPGRYQLVAPLQVAVISAAMPNVVAMPNGDQTFEPGSDEWTEDVALRLRAVLSAALQAGHDALILGAFGCSIGNPPALVANMFATTLASAEFRGRFSLVVFAILEPGAGDRGNLAQFRAELSKICPRARS